MAEHQTKIEWTHIPGYRGVTWNPVTGCSRVSDGCINCYAEELATGRLKGSPGYPGLPWTASNADVNVIEHPDRLDQPLSWTTPRAVFVNSMSDLFHENISIDFLDQVFTTMARTPQHIYMILTKRPETMLAYLTQNPNGPWFRVNAKLWEAAVEVLPGGGPLLLPNVWFGVSVERQRELDQRVPLLLATPAAVRFVSAEPLLGPLDFENVEAGDYVIDALGGAWAPDGEPLVDTTLDWVIVGGESGPKRRTMRLDWLSEIVETCNRAMTPVFVKQDSAHRPGQQGRIDDALWAEKSWPEVFVPA